MEFIFSQVPSQCLLCLGTYKRVGDTPEFWQLLSSSAQHQRCLSIVHPPTSSLGVGKILAETQPGQLTQTDQRDIPYHMMPAQREKLSKGGGRERNNTGYLQCLPSRATVTYAAAQLHGKWLNIACWWEVEDRGFLSLLMCAWTFAFAFLNCLISTCGLFSICFLTRPAEKGSGRLA